MDAISDMDWLDEHIKDGKYVFNIEPESSGSMDVETSFEIKPHDFLKFAEYDLNNKYDHHLVNALSNIKRAIDSQIDSLLVGFGLYEKSRGAYDKSKRKLTFPAKINELNSIGVISPRILEKINKKRNLLEHEYANPKQEDVEDALDIATLFIHYTDKYLFNALEDAEGFCEESGTDHYFDAKLVYTESKIIFTAPYWENGEYKGTKTVKEIHANSEEYLKYLKWFLELYKVW